MPIVIARGSGAVVSAPSLPQNEINALWERIVEKYLQIHPEILRDEMDGMKSVRAGGAYALQSEACADH